MRWLRRALLVLAVLFAVAQFFRPVRANPPVEEAKTLYASVSVPPDVRAILERSCRDCHSNTTTWPWYSNISPVSWWLVDHVTHGREELNFSQWGSYTDRRRRRKLEEICEEVKEGVMPLESYLPLHPHARLGEHDRDVLCRWTASLLRQIPPPSAGGEG